MIGAHTWEVCELLFCSWVLFFLRGEPKHAVHATVLAVLDKIPLVEKEKKKKNGLSCASVNNKGKETKKETVVSCSMTALVCTQ